MHRLRDVSAGILFGATIYGVSHIGMPTAEEAAQYNASVVECGDNLTGVGKEVETVPLPCEKFIYYYQPLDSTQVLDANGRPAYYLPDYAEFRSDFPLITPSDERASEAQWEHDARVRGALLGALLFGSMRFIAMVNRKGQKDQQKKQRVTTLPYPTIWQPNEDAPDYPKAFPNIP